MKTILTIEQKLFRKMLVNPITQCWEWTGHITPNGYGLLGVGSRKDKTRGKKYTHRLSFTIHKGQIPKNKEIDHLCRNRKCFNPVHLELVTRRENVMRGIGPKLLGELNSSKEKCKNGHKFDKINTYIRPNGGRSCRECLKLRARNYRKQANRKVMD